MEHLEDTSLGESAEDFYNAGISKRTGPVNVARELAAISSPITFPPEHWQAGDPLEVTNQSVNAYALNTLSTKMMLGSMPPGLPGFKFVPEEHKLDEDIQSDPELFSQVQYALSRRADIHRERMEATRSRSAITKYYKLLLLCGNAACLWTDINNPVIYNMHHYVVKRDAGGQAIAGVIKTSVSRMVADEDVVAAHDRGRKDTAEKAETGSKWDEEIDIYHCLKLLRKGKQQEYVYWQETCGGEVIDDTVAYNPIDYPTIYFGGMVPEYGSDWFIPYCQDYAGDMLAVENFASAMQDGAAAAARFLIGVDPNGSADIKDVMEADNLDVVSAKEGDVFTIRSDKQGDLQVTAGEMEKAVRRLGQGFLMFSAIQRTGERVTAEEWRILSTEIDQAMGGLYSDIAQTSQRWFVHRFIFLHHEDDPKLAKLPEDLVRIKVGTGIDSLSQSSEGTNLREFMMEASEELAQPALAQNINVGDYLRRKASHKNIKSDGLVKNADQLAADNAQMKQDAMQQTLLDKATGPLAQGGADILGQMVEGGGAQLPEGLTPGE